jgi:hypothetical protein
MSFRRKGFSLHLPIGFRYLVRLDDEQAPVLALDNFLDPVPTKVVRL